MQISQVLGGYTLGRADLLRRAMGKKKAEVMAGRARRLPRGLREERRRPEGRRRDLRPDGEVRRVRLQQVATPPPTASSPSTPRGSRRTTRSSSWPRCSPARRTTPTRWWRTSPRRARRARGAAAGREPVGPGLRRGGGEDPLRPRRHQGRGRGRDRGDPRGAQGRARSRACSTSASAWTRRRVNRKVIEALVKAGAFDFEKRPRRQLFETIETRAGARRRPPSATGRWGSPRSSACSPRRPRRRRPALQGRVRAASRSGRRRSGSRFEKEAIGFYVSGHPLHQYEKELQALRAAQSPRCSARAATRRSPSPASWRRCASGPPRPASAWRG